MLFILLYVCISFSLGFIYTNGRRNQIYIVEEAREFSRGIFCEGRYASGGKFTGIRAIYRFIFQR